MIDWIKKTLRRFRRLITYGVMGIINTAVDYAVFYLLYRGAGMAIALSQNAGFLCGSVCGYFLNSNLTFKEGKGRTHAQFLQYFGVDIVLSLLSGAFMHWAEDWHVPVLALKALVTVAVALLHYTIYKYLVFRIKKEEK